MVFTLAQWDALQQDKFHVPLFSPEYMILPVRLWLAEP